MLIGNIKLDDKLVLIYGWAYQQKRILISYDELCRLLAVNIMASVAVIERDI